jgi:hypothetical protein
MFADALLELGDQIDPNEWEAIDQSEYNVDSNITETALNMSSYTSHALVHLRNVQANKIPNFSRLDTNIKVVCHQKDHFVVK